MKKNSTPSLTHGNVGIQGIQTAIDILIKIKKENRENDILSQQLDDALYNLEYAGEMMDESIQLHFSNYLKEIRTQYDQGVRPELNIWVGEHHKCNLPCTSAVYHILLEHYSPEEMTDITQDYLKRCQQDTEIIQLHIKRITYFYKYQEIKPHRWVPLIALFLSHVKKDNYTADLADALITEESTSNTETLPVLFQYIDFLNSTNMTQLRKKLKQYKTESFKNLPWNLWRKQYKTPFFNELLVSVIDHIKNKDGIEESAVFERMVLNNLQAQEQQEQIQAL